MPILEKTPLELHREQEFSAMTKKLHDALASIKGDKNLVPDQKTLCGLAGCSRRLLNTPERRWVADALLALKQARVDKPRAEDKDERAAKKLTEEKARIQALELQLVTMQSQHAGLVHETLDAQDKAAELQRELTAQKRVSSQAEARLKDAQGLIAKLQRSLADGGISSNVIPLISREGL